MVAFQLNRKAAAVLARQHSTMGAIEDAQAIKASFQPEKHRRLVPFLYGTIVPTGWLSTQFLFFRKDLLGERIPSAHHHEEGNSPFLKMAVNWDSCRKPQASLRSTPHRS